MSSGQDASQRARHLVGDVQRFGLLSAATIVERYIATVDRALANHPLTGPGTFDQQDAGRLVDAGWLVDGATRVADAGTRVLDAVARLIANGTGEATPAGAEDRLVLPSAQPGTHSEVSLWIHNPTPSPVSQVDLHATALASPTGLTIPAGAVTLSPPRVEVLAASGRQEVRLRVDVPADQPAGHYHGLVLSSAAPSDPLALRLEVQAQGGQER